MAKHGGARKGAGRKKGKKNQKTIEKERVLASVRQRIMENADLILNSQLSLARGQQFLFKIEKELQIGPKGGRKYVSSKPKLVTNVGEIEAYLEGKYEDGDPEDDRDPNATYYFITVKEPNNMAIDSLFNRAFGKPKESVELSGKDGGPLTLSHLFEVASSRKPEEDDRPRR